MSCRVLKIFLPLLLLLFAGLANGQDAASDVERFREIRDKSFRDPVLTPLLRQDFLNFKGLEYFDVDAKFELKAKFEKTTDDQLFVMPTTGGTTRKYFKYGILTFELESQKSSLNVYRSEASAIKNGLLFVPFRDLTNGAETYGAGRYLDIEPPAGAEAKLDFNFAYNMSCAYGREEFSCTIPPKENFLQIEIKAGEKIFPHSAKK
jgi:uncharacterized protein